MNIGAVLAWGLACAGSLMASQTGWTLIGWNDLGMHCMDGDYSIYAILPPYNNIRAQLIDFTGKLVTNPAGVTVTYSAVGDPAGSINSLSAQKTNFWQYAGRLFGVSFPAEVGLAMNVMPGAGSALLRFDPARNLFAADGVPLTPYDDAGNKNPYPMMRLTARDSGGKVLATTDIVLPVSDEMDCSTCHASGSQPATRPSAGWAWNSIGFKDYKYNILRLHDDRQRGSSSFAAALAASGYSSAGLYATVTANSTPVLCAQCHATNALGTPGQPDVPPLTQSIHQFHAQVADPATGLALDAEQNRSACYNCHPGSETRCLRGAMGNSVAADGSLAIQCQNCHGSMSAVGALRQGWLDEPNCQACHTGTAVSNRGQIRFTSVFDASGQVRQPADTRFATNPNTPSAGFSLFKLSSGHGGLQCEACHGSTHAEFPSSHINDNVQSNNLQGHPGVLAECSACHTQAPSTTNGGPHGMHPVGQAWVQAHPDVAERGTSACQDCHGTDYRGTVLSRASADRTLSAFGTKQLWRGFQVGCYACHRGPSSESSNPNRAPIANNASASTSTAQPVVILLGASDPDGNSITLSMVSQPANGAVALNGSTATYAPFSGWEGTDSFTFAAWDGSTNSNLATVVVAVTSPQRPSVSAQGVVSAASYQGGAVAPGEMVAIFGNGMGPGAGVSPQVNTAGLLTRSLAGTRVLFDGQAAPMIYTSAGQLAAMVPYRVAASASTQIQVEYQGIRSTAVSVPITATLPGLFAADASGRGPGTILNQDGITLNSTAQPAPKDSIVVLYATGEGVLDTSVMDGQLATFPLPQPVAPVGVKIDGIDAEVTYGGSVFTQVFGFLQVNVRIPTGVRSGPVPVVLTVGNASSQTGVTLVVE